MLRPLTGVAALHGVRRTLLWSAAAAVLAALGASVLLGYGRRLWYPSFVAIAGGQTHGQVVTRLGPIFRPGLRAAAREAGSRYPPERLWLIGLKQERVLEVWAPGSKGWRRLRSYPVLAASGGRGPKLQEGDNQVPEGLYRLTAFNPNSSYHLSVRVGYPNQDDRAAAAAEGRVHLGGDIYIHGKAVSIGCLAIGDRGIEELYVLLADTGLANSSLVLAPSARPEAPGDAPRWWRPLYRRIGAALSEVRGSPPD